MLPQEAVRILTLGQRHHADAHASVKEEPDTALRSCPTRSITVKDENGASVPSAAVSVSWRLPDGSTQDQTASTSNNGLAKFSTSGRRGTYTLSINNITKVGYTFDRTNSVLTKAITK